MMDIKAHIQQKGLTNKHVAKMVGIDPSTLSKIIKKVDRYGSPETIGRINTYLDLVNSDDPNIFSAKS